MKLGFTTEALALMFFCGFSRINLSFPPTILKQEMSELLRLLQPLNMMDSKMSSRIKYFFSYAKIVITIV